MGPGAYRRKLYMDNMSAAYRIMDREIKMAYRRLRTYRRVNMVYRKKMMELRMEPHCGRCQMLGNL